MLSTIRQGTLHGSRSEKFQIGRCNQHTLGRFKKAVFTKQDDRTRQSHKGRLKSTYTKQADKEAKMASKQISARPKVGPMMKQPTFDWDTEDKYNELKSFILEVYNVFKSCDMPDTEKTASIKNWLGRKVLQLFKTLTQAKKKNMKHPKDYSKH